MPGRLKETAGSAAGRGITLRAGPRHTTNDLPSRRIYPDLLALMLIPLEGHLDRCVGPPDQVRLTGLDGSFRSFVGPEAIWQGHQQIRSRVTEDGVSLFGNQTASNLDGLLP